LPGDSDTRQRDCRHRGVHLQTIGHSDPNGYGKGGEGLKQAIYANDRLIGVLYIIRYTGSDPVNLITQRVASPEVWPARAACY
jgi:hypothetical protein